VNCAVTGGLQLFSGFFSIRSRIRRAGSETICVRSGIENAQ
jgi:hypothetical protein